MSSLRAGRRPFGQPARLRELARVSARLTALDRERSALIERRKRLLLDDQQSVDASTHDELAGACGLERSSVSGALKRLRDQMKEAP